MNRNESKSLLNISMDRIDGTAQTPFEKSKRGCRVHMGQAQINHDKKISADVGLRLKEFKQEIDFELMQL
ncbi:CLUMA_CG007247, isoform A [Clunio marinus]|uniref:CLUMA_CG007247, isoform A n=1 Tax=Clunio marinus TaxID=568069 RepID=A0A1J1I039_9DIPT|nr:CLUMA_CG007247, isoform A [Clunio marinus]